MTKGGRGRGRRQWDAMGAVGKVGTVVTTLGAIVALATGVKALLPEDKPPPSGDIVELEHTSDEVLSDVADSLPDETRCPGIEKRRRFKVGASPVVATISLGGPLAQGEMPTVPPGDPPPEPPPPDGTVPEVPPPDGLEPRPEGEPEEGDDESEVVDELVQQTELDDERVEDLLFNAPPGRDADISEQQVETIIRNTRLGYPRGFQKDASARLGAGALVPVQGGGPEPLPPGQGVLEGREPLGWLIDVSTLLKELKGKCAYVQWTVYNARTRRRVNRSWLVDRRGVRFIPRGSPDQRSASFWVPIPRAAGPYQLKVALYDTEATRLDIGRVKRLP